MNTLIYNVVRNTFSICSHNTKLIGLDLEC